MRTTLILHYGTEEVQLSEPVKIKHNIDKYYPGVQYYVSSTIINSRQIITFHYILSEAIEDIEMTYLELTLKLTYKDIQIYKV